MVQSLNKKVDLTINATSYLGMANYGKVLVGDEAFEYYNDKNVNDYIQIPWSEVTEIMASVMFKGKWIPRFAVVTKNNGNFIFSTRDNKKTLRAVRNYVDGTLAPEFKSQMENLSQSVVNMVRGGLQNDASEMIAQKTAMLNELKEQCSQHKAEFARRKETLKQYKEKLSTI